MAGHEDWGARAARWRGVRSEHLRVHGTTVHVLRADGPEDGTPQLLVHGLGGAATNWLEVLVPLAEQGPVVAVDLPGFGRTEPPRPTDSRVTTNARFLRALLDRLGWETAVVHGNSMGGMLGVLLAELAPERTAGLVLASPALPGPRSRVHRTPPRTLLRFAPFALPGLAGPVLSRVWSRMTPREQYEEHAAYIHADPGRLSPELAEVAVENVAYGREQPWRLESFVAAGESLVGLLVGGRRVRRALESPPLPGLLLWGDRDPLIGRAVIEAVGRRRPDWDLEVLAGVGHCPQIEVPRRYVDAVSAWWEHRAAPRRP